MTIECGYGKTCSLPDTVYGICPSGWHLPTKTEWNTLITNVGGQSSADKDLKSQTGWDGGYKRTDPYGFSALPAGFRISYGNFFYAGSNTYFWSAAESDGEYAYNMGLNFRDLDAHLTDNGKYYGFSIRCLKD